MASSTPKQVVQQSLALALRSIMCAEQQLHIVRRELLIVRKHGPEDCKAETDLLYTYAGRMVDGMKQETARLRTLNAAIKTQNEIDRALAVIQAAEQKQVQPVSETPLTGAD
jgi:hypothetical protein